jgi:hypothetical protein
MHPKSARRGLLAFAALVALAGCGPTTAPLSYSNGTTIPIDLVVNGSTIVTMQPGAGGEIQPALLPGQPWTVQAMTSSRRLLLSFVVRPGDVQYGSTSTRGDAARVDLACGRLDVWSGPPLFGPAPDPSLGRPGDCAP